MQYVLTDGNGQVLKYPYNKTLLQRDNKDISFSIINDTVMARYNAFPVREVTPTIAETQKLQRSSTPVYQDGEWLLVHVAVDKSQAEIDAYYETLSNRVHDAIKSKVDAKMDNLKNGYAEREIQSWPIQLKEAEALLADPSAPTPFLSNAKRDSETVAEYAAKVRANNAAWSTYAGQVVGWRSEMEDALDACTTEADYKTLLETINNA